MNSPLVLSSDFNEGVKQRENDTDREKGRNA